MRVKKFLRITVKHLLANFRVTALVAFFAACQSPGENSEGIPDCKDLMKITADQFTGRNIKTTAVLPAGNLSLSISREGDSMELYVVGRGCYDSDSRAYIVFRDGTKRTIMNSLVNCEGILVSYIAPRLITAEAYQPLQNLEIQAIRLAGTRVIETELTKEQSSRILAAIRCLMSNK